MSLLSAWCQWRERRTFIRLLRVLDKIERQNRLPLGSLDDIFSTVTMRARRQIHFQAWVRS